MFQSLRRSFAEFKELKRFQSLPGTQRQVVFYSESKADWPHLGPVVEKLLAQSQSVAYFASDSADPVFRHNHPQLHHFLIGSGSARTTLFRTLAAPAFVMTLSDLDQFYLKRSPDVGHYFYLFHSINSTHMVYLETALDAYDTIFCVGPHHMSEIRQREMLKGLKPKRLIPQGYPRLDSLMEKMRQRPAEKSSSADQSLRICLAPSWGEGSFIEKLPSLDWIKTLLKQNIKVYLRLHPMTPLRLPELIEKIQKELSTDPGFMMILDVSEQDSVLSSDLMVSDWSGAGYEFAFTLEKPVIYLDTPRKIRNPNYKALGLPCLEVEIRKEIGHVLPLEQLDSLADLARKMVAERSQWREKIAASRKKWVYHPGESAEIAAKNIQEYLREYLSSQAHQSKNISTISSEENP